MQGVERIDRIDTAILAAISRHGARRALVDVDGAPVSYEDLAGSVEGMATVLAAAGIQPGQTVCILMEKSAAALAAILATAKVGGVFIPLDPASPAPRIAAMMALCGPAAVVADQNKLPRARDCIMLLDAQGVSRPDLFALDRRSPDRRLERVGASSARDPDRRALQLPPDIAYLLMTSGSTGVPKAVPIRHDSVMQVVRWCNDHFGIDRDDRMICHAPLQFDTSLWDYLGGFLAGAEVHLVPPALNLVPERLVAFARDRALTRWASVPSAFRNFIRRDVLVRGDWPNLRSLCWYGEPMAVPVLRYLMDRLGHVRFANLYGPTEAAVLCSCFDVPIPPAPHETSVPIGWAIDDKPIHIIDETGQVCAADVPGELVVGGPHLSPGYLGRPDLTARVFVEWPPGSGQTVYRTGDLARTDETGRLHFLGRNDRQIKRLGYRLELDDIASHIEALPGISTCAVVAIPDETAQNRICVACEAGRGPPPNSLDLRRRLAELVPEYMIPQHWAFFETLPQTASGKIDTRAVLAHFLSHSSDDHAKRPSPPAPDDLEGH